MDPWAENGDQIESELGLVPRRPWYWPFKGTLHGLFRGFNVRVTRHEWNGGDVPLRPHTDFRVDFDERVIGPPGFRMVGPGPVSQRGLVTVSGYQYKADSTDELNVWLTDERRSLLKETTVLDGVSIDNLPLYGWGAKRNWQRLILSKWDEEFPFPDEVLGRGGRPLTPDEEEAFEIFVSNLTSVSTIRSGLDELIDRVEAMR
jgi:hypothetical protein